MKIGLKSGTVELNHHNPEWEILAAETIQQLWHILGDVAVDIQHVGSTAITGIKAKPIIDIAVAVRDYNQVIALSPVLKSKGFIYRKQENHYEESLLFACGDYSQPDRIVTHFIHVVMSGGTEYINYLNFRDYMNTHPDEAKAYEALKVRLMEENPIDPGREKYLAGKKDFITERLTFARIWDDFGREFTHITPITKGWSEDKKYCVTKADGIKYLLRVTPIERYETRKALFEMLKRVDALGIPMCRPVDFGTCTEGVYSLQTWIDGEDLEDVLPLLSETEQYVLGLKSGEIVRKMHSIPAPETNLSGVGMEEWAARFNRKTNHKIQKYRECGVRFEGDDKVISYIEANRHLLENRPQCFQHGDYHVGNMMLENGELRIIDFDRYDFGDPWEELGSIAWSAQKSPHFATGQLRGYFGESPLHGLEPPIAFFKLLAFYIGSNTLSSIYWALDFDNIELETMMNQANDVLSWYDNMQNPVPTWYLKDFYIQYIDGIPFKLKAPFDFSFISKYGKVFKVFDDQDGGNVCFGVEKDGNRYFVKFAGAPQMRYEGKKEDAINRLKASIQVYQDIGSHPSLIRFIGGSEIGGGFATVFEWTDAQGMARMYPMNHKLFMDLPIEKRIKVFEDIMSFHDFVCGCGYVAIDFYDGSIMYDFGNEKTVICDIDFYQKMPYRGEMGLWGSSRFVSPEECRQNEIMDEVTTVYTMGATAFCLFTDSERSCEVWPLSEAQYAVVKKAVSDDRNERQQSIKELIMEWNNARTKE